MLLMRGWCRANTLWSAGQSSAVCGCHAQTALWNLSALQPFSARSLSILALCCNFLSVGLWLRCAIIIKIFCLVGVSCLCNVCSATPRPCTSCLWASVLTSLLPGVLLEVSQASQLFRLLSKTYFCGHAIPMSCIKAFLLSFMRSKPEMGEEKFRAGAGFLWTWTDAADFSVVARFLIYTLPLHIVYKGNIQKEIITFMSSVAIRSLNLSDGLKKQRSFKPHLDCCMLCLHVAVDLVELFNCNLSQMWLDLQLVCGSLFVRSVESWGLPAEAFQGLGMAVGRHSDTGEACVHTQAWGWEVCPFSREPCSDGWRLSYPMAPNTRP